MWNNWLKSWRGRLILMSLLIVNIPILVAGYAMKHNAEQSLLEEKKNKLAAVSRILDSRLGQDSFDAILRRHGAENATREEKIKILNSELSAMTDEIALSAPGLGAGFYSRDLDAIVTYGPAAQFGHTVGLPIGPTHPGRAVMATNQFRVEFGTLVRGNIMNAMQPIHRDGRVIGYIWVNELTDDIEAQLAAMDRGLFISMTAGLLLSLILILLVTGSMTRDVQSVIEGLRKLRFNLRQPIAGVTGEMGEVAATINEMAAALGDARTMSENIMDSMADGVIAVDTFGKITAFNKAAETMTGFSAAEVVGKYYEEIFSQDASFTSRLMETLRTGEPYIGSKIEYPIRHGKLWISVSTSMLRDIDGNILGAVVVFEDLTERKRLEEQVSAPTAWPPSASSWPAWPTRSATPHQHQRLPPVLSERRQREERATYLPMLMREVDRMNRIIETLLYFSRPYQERATPTDLGKILQDTMILLRSEAKSHGIAFDTFIDEQLPLVNIDGEQFKQVFLNLMINSLQAMDHEGTIRVTARYLKDSDEVEVLFADTGPGIPAAIREKVFDPFFTTKQTGTGLGLAIVQRIVFARGGHIRIDDNPAGGAVIRVLIPREYKQEE
jgi:two-component system sensor histidine kinase AtoS